MKSDAPLSLQSALADAMTQLQAAILRNLIVILRPRVDVSSVVLLSASVLSELASEPAVSDEAKQYFETHSSLVDLTARAVAPREEFAEALSYFYAAKTLYLVFVTKNPFSEEAAALGRKATELGIDIPNTYDICGSGDAKECIHAILEFAGAYWRRHLTSEK
jgi:hypothetical protein